MFVAIEKMHADLVRASTSNQVLYDHVADLRGRVDFLENENTQLRAILDNTRVAKRPAPKLSLAISKLDINEKPGSSTPSSVSTVLL